MLSDLLSLVRAQEEEQNRPVFN